MVVLHLTTSPLFGGPERQLLGFALAMPSDCRMLFLLFRDRGKSQAFRSKLEENGLETHLLKSHTPHLPAMVSEIAHHLRVHHVDLLCCHGYKADVVGLLAARRVGISVISVSRGWTGSTWKVRRYEQIDRACLRRMDRVICVSDGQAVKVRKAGVSPDRVVVIRNAIQPERFASPDPSARGELLGLFRDPPQRIVGAAGRLSPEKGFDVLVDAAAIAARTDPRIGFIQFGDGHLRDSLAKRVHKLGIGGRFIWAGFREDLDRLITAWDLAVLPSYSEGLPNIALEAFCAGVPVVGTAVGGIPEVVEDGVSGYLVPPGDPQALARGILAGLGSENRRRLMGERGRRRVANDFTFPGMVTQYQQLFAELLAPTNADVFDHV
jgi:glycosyltransferase involved in cell wall biosynthesis